LLQEAEEPFHVLGRRGKALCLPLRLRCLLQEAEEPFHGLGILTKCDMFFVYYEFDKARAEQKPYYYI
jgi:hypothetical protein